MFLNIYTYICRCRIMNIWKTFSTFALAPPWWRAKVLLKLSSLVKFSQNFNVAKIIGNGITSLVCIALCGYLHILWCGLLSSSRDKGNARSLTKGIKAISSHTFFIEKASSGNLWGTKLFN